MTKPDPDDTYTNEVWSQEHHNTFANRTISTVFWTIGIVAVLVIAGFMFSAQDSSQGTQSASETTASGDTNLSVNVDANPAEEVGLIAQIFHGLFGTENLEPFDLNKSPVNEMAELETLYNMQENVDDGYRMSFYDVLNGDIISSEGENAGNLHDIIIDKETGEAKAIVIEKDKRVFDRELGTLSFSQVLSQEPDGDTQLTITETTLDAKTEFDYANIDYNQYISLRSLEDGQVIDDKSEYVGEIDALIYQNAEVQDVYFYVDPSLTPHGRANLVKIPFDELNVVKNASGFDIQLSTEKNQRISRISLPNKGEVIMVEEEEYIVTVEKRRPYGGLSMFIWTVLSLIILIGVPVYLLTNDRVVEVEPNKPVPVQPYHNSTEDTLPETAKALEEDTDILTQSVYGSDDEIIGTIYNAYADPNEGDVLWISVTENDNPDEGVRLISTTDTEDLENGNPAYIDMTREGFLEIPVQKNVDERLNGLISLRHLPGSLIYEPDKTQAGTVTKVSYYDGNLRNVYFRSNEKEYYIPFEAFDYKTLGNTYSGNYQITLSERQAGSLDAYSKAIP